MKRYLEEAMYLVPVSVGVHPSWERSAMEFAKEFVLFFVFFRQRSACALTNLQTPLSCRQGDLQHQPNVGRAIFWSKFREESTEDRRKPMELAARFPALN